jgi:hypothetical protein
MIKNAGILLITFTAGILGKTFSLLGDLHLFRSYFGIYQKL